MTAVLLIGDESPASLAAVRALHDGRYRVYLAIYRKDTYAQRSRRCAGVVSVRDPLSDAAGHAADVAAAARRLQAAAVLPGTEGAMRAITGREGLFEATTVVGTCPRETLDLATDKYRLASLAVDAGLDAVPTTIINDGDELPARPSFPMIVKPLRSIADDGASLHSLEVCRVADMAQLKLAIAAADRQPVLLQPWIRGQLAAICGVAWKGELVCAVHQVSSRIWPPEQGITAYAVTVAPDLQRERGVAALLRSISWSGIFGVQFLIDGDRAYAIDLNPRIYGSIGLAIAAGCNLPAIWADLLLGAEPPRRGSIDYRPGTRYRVEEDDFRALAHSLGRAPLAQTLRGFLPRRRTAHAVFSIRDPKPLLTTIAKLRPHD